MSDVHLLLEEQIPSLIRYASALTRDPEEAMALVEDTVLAALRSGDRRPGGTELRLRLLAILHEQRANPFRQADPMATAPEAVGDPAAEFTLSDFDWALGRLPEAQRAVILLVGLEGLSYPQTARVLQISLGTVRSRLARGRDNLRRLMGVFDETEPAKAA